MKYLSIIIITAIIVAGGVYFWQEKNYKNYILDPNIIKTFYSNYDVRSCDEAFPSPELLEVDFRRHSTTNQLSIGLWDQDQGINTDYFM